MKIILFTVFVLFSLEAFTQELNEYQWKNRLVVLVSNASKSSELNQQYKIFEQNRQQLQERDMILLKRKSNAKDLTRFSLDKNFEGVLLIGKDGSIKLKKTFLIEPQVVFDLVDTMPMRRAEMRNSDKY
ncbi:MAG: DUF4174 domain-containing protein [Bacteroidota bacterium]